jgi:hypothetical protein
MTRSRVGSQANPIQSNFRRVTGGHPPFFEFSCPPMPACAAGVRGRGRASKPAIFARVAGPTGTELFCARRERYTGLQPRTTTLGELSLLVQSLRLGTISRPASLNVLRKAHWPGAGHFPAPDVVGGLVGRGLHYQVSTDSRDGGSRKPNRSRKPSEKTDS